MNIYIFILTATYFPSSAMPNASQTLTMFDLTGNSPLIVRSTKYITHNINGRNVSLQSIECRNFNKDLELK